MFILITNLLMLKINKKPDLDRFKVRFLNYISTIFTASIGCTVTSMIFPG